MFDILLPVYIIGANLAGGIHMLTRLIGRGAIADTAAAISGGAGDSSVYVRYIVDRAFFNAARVAERVAEMVEEQKISAGAAIVLYEALADDG
jgi:hypothetical protein